MCQKFIEESKFYQSLFQLDQGLAREVQQNRCCFCGEGVLHCNNYPRKPRGVPRWLLGKDYTYRFSFCCDREGCRRRTTPPSVRFLGRRVYLGVMVILLSALRHGLTPKRRTQLIQTLDIPTQTLNRWLHWWREIFAFSPWWQREKACYMPPIEAAQLPGGWLMRLSAATLQGKVIQLLRLLSPITTNRHSIF